MPHIVWEAGRGQTQQTPHWVVGGLVEAGLEAGWAVAGWAAGLAVAGLAVAGWAVAFPLPGGDDAAPAHSHAAALLFVRQAACLGPAAHTGR